MPTKTTLTPTSERYDWEADYNPPRCHVPLARVVPATEVFADWPRHQFQFERALHYSHRPQDNIEAVAESLAAGSAWVVDVTHRDNELLATAVIERMDTKAGEYINIWLCAGDAVHTWLDEILSCIEGWAAMIGACGVMMGGRPGWRRLLSSRGYGEQSVIMGKTL